jgi:hypothetical protein
MICPKCNFEQPCGMQECTRCGVIFAKLRLPADREVRPEEIPVAPDVISAGLGGLLSHLRESFTAIEPDEPLFIIAGRGIMLVLMLVWGVRFILAPISSGYAAETPLHLIHLPFHEAGHVIFGLPGFRFITVLGGTLGQLLIPVIVMYAFVVRKNPFGGSVGLWWLGQSFMDVAIYANDARSGQLPLLGGVTGSEVEDYHDWEVMLGKLGWLTYDHMIARLFYACGALLLLLALAWGGFVLWRQSRLLLAGREAE